MKSSAIMAAVAILSCLLVLCAQGRPVPESSRCQCSNGFTKIQGSMLRKPHQFHVQHPTNFCPNTEIILTLAGGKKKCVDPKSRLGGLERSYVTTCTDDAAAWKQISKSIFSQKHHHHIVLLILRNQSKS
uniref:Chemokine interleukin-8-like domain-containing protein n=1 Tax=Salarias fasciatus TaxID=181472 RepID=A0A672HQ46_SALFA